MKRKRKRGIKNRRLSKVMGKKTDKIMEMEVVGVVRAIDNISKIMFSVISHSKSMIFSNGF